MAITISSISQSANYHRKINIDKPKNLWFDANYAFDQMDESNNPQDRILTSNWNLTYNQYYSSDANITYNYFPSINKTSIQYNATGHNTINFSNVFSEYITSNVLNLFFIADYTFLNKDSIHSYSIYITDTIHTNTYIYIYISNSRIQYEYFENSVKIKSRAWMDILISNGLQLMSFKFNENMDIRLQINEVLANYSSSFRFLDDPVTMTPTFTQTSIQINKRRDSDYNSIQLCEFVIIKESLGKARFKRIERDLMYKWGII